MSAALQYVLSGLAVGAVYSLVGLGFTIMWSACRAANFSHGDVLMLGAVFAVVLVAHGFMSVLPPLQPSPAPLRPATVAARRIRSLTMSGP